ncbi:MAG: lipoyl synthase [Acidimicrobiales bacterium]
MLRIRWLGRVTYPDAHALQRALHDRGSDDHLLLLEHPHVYTLGVRAKAENVLAALDDLGAPLVRADRGGDVTYHGPGQLVGYPVLSIHLGPGATPSYVAAVEQLVVDSLADLGLEGAGRLPGYPGVWVGQATEHPRKICAIGVRLTRGRSMHGFALNVDPDLSRFDKIVPCGIPDKAVTSLAAEGVKVSMAEVVDAVAARAAKRWGQGGTERQDVAAGRRRLTCGPGGGAPGGGGADGSGQGSGPGTVQILPRKPEWLRVKADLGAGYRSLRGLVRGLDLVTVCEEAGCPNIYECWSDGTATFMINGERCSRACGFCLVDSGRPLALEPGEAERVAAAVERLGLAHAVVTAVARDDLPDGGAAAMAATVEAIHSRCPGTAVEVLIPDCKGAEAALGTIFAARPEVLNHNLETVARLQRAVRPSASYARSLAVLGRAAAAGLLTKSGMMVGLGERFDEVVGALGDLRGVGVRIVTLGQYLRPSAAHLPVARYWTPGELDELGDVARSMGFDHVEASPLTRSSYHARAAAEAAGSGAGATAGGAGGTAAGAGAVAGAGVAAAGGAGAR